MSEKIKKVLVVVFVVVTIGIISYLFLTGIKDAEQALLMKNLQDQKFVSSKVQLVHSSYGKNIYQINHIEEITPFQQVYQEVVDEKINEKLENDYSVSEPLMIYNPYGTNKNSINLYFQTEEKVEVEYTVQTQGFSDFTRTLKNDGEGNLTTEHAYQIIGLIVGKKNTLTLKLKDASSTVIEEVSFEIDFTNISSSVTSQLKIKEGESKEELTEGLFVMFGHDKAYQANNYLYDTNGVLRSELVLEEYRSDRIIFDDDFMIYSYKEDGLIKVNRLGKIVRQYHLSDYCMHHDYILDKSNETVFILANKKGADTIEDRVIALNLHTGKVREVIDMKDYFEEFYHRAVKPEKNTYGGDELDWIHLNSLDIIDSRDVVLSSRELSMIIYVQDIYTNPKVKYIITDPSVVSEGGYKDFNLLKKGDFISQAGQHTITYQKEYDGKYYLYMYNNNYQGARTRPNFNWENYVGTGTYQEGENSYYYKYLIDENKKTYELVEKIALPYSSIVSSVEHVSNHYVTSSGMSHCFDEYDQEGLLIREFQYTSKKYAYRIFKYDFRDIWFS